MNIILGNAISFFGAFFLFASCVAKTKRRLVILQFFQCVILTTAQIVFGKGSGAVSMSAAGIRNLIIASEHYNVFIMILVVIFTVAFGLYFNTAGYLGLLPIVAGAFYSSALYFAKDVRVLKMALSVLLFTWIVYSALIFDIFGMISNTIAQILNVITLQKLKRQRHVR